MLIVVGSRRDGNSLKLANRICKELDRVRIPCKIIIPGNQRIHLCTGCMDCDKTGVCDFTDDMAANIEEIKKTDVLTFITPTRWNLLSGDLKIFMDRLNPLYSTKDLKNKKGIAISIGAKHKDVYSSFEATSSLRSFMEASGMECILAKDINDCKEADDIERSSEVDELIQNILRLVQN